MTRSTPAGHRIHFAREKVAYVHRLMQALQDRRILKGLHDHLRTALVSQSILTGNAPLEEERRLGPEGRATRQVELWSQVGKNLDREYHHCGRELTGEDGLWSLIASLRLAGRNGTRG